MWVDPAWRGAGLGSRMLRALEDARRRAGYRRIGRYNDNPYATDLLEKSLTPPDESAR